MQMYCFCINHINHLFLYLPDILDSKGQASLQQQTQHQYLVYESSDWCSVSVGPVLPLASSHKKSVKSTHKSPQKVPAHTAEKSKTWKFQKVKV